MAAAPSIGRSTAKPLPLAREEGLATHRLYERYSRQIHAFCLHQLGNREEAEDAVQSTFMNAFVGLGRGVVPEFESAWLYTIAKNVCLTRQRMSYRRRLVEAPRDLDAIQDLVPSQRSESDELFGLSDALQGMPEQQRRALLLREWQGLTYKEIAEELELSHAAVEALLFRARRSLAERLTPEENVPELKHATADSGVIVTLLKSLLFSGGAKAAATLATVAATSSVAATPTVRHAVSDGIASVAAEVAPAPKARPKPQHVIVQHAKPLKTPSAPAVVHVQHAPALRRNTTIVHSAPAPTPVRSSSSPAQAPVETKAAAPVVASPAPHPAVVPTPATNPATPSPSPVASPTRPAAVPAATAPAQAPDSPVSPQPAADDPAGSGAISAPSPQPSAPTAQPAPARATANATPAAPAPAAPAGPNVSGFSATPVSSPSAPIESTVPKGAAPSSPVPVPAPAGQTPTTPSTTTTSGTSTEAAGTSVPATQPAPAPAPAPSQPTITLTPSTLQPTPVGSSKFAAPLD